MNIPVKQSRLPDNRIKKIMQANKEIGKIQNTTPTLIGRALELFLEEITKLSAHVALTNNDSKITPSHIKAALSNGDLNKLEKFTFLREAMSKIPDLKVLEQPVAEVEGNYLTIDVFVTLEPLPPVKIMIPAAAGGGGAKRKDKAMDKK